MAFPPRYAQPKGRPAPRKPSPVEHAKKRAAVLKGSAQPPMRGAPRGAGMMRAMSHEDDY